MYSYLRDTTLVKGTPRSFTYRFYALVVLLMPHEHLLLFHGDILT